MRNLFTASVFLVALPCAAAAQPVTLDQQVLQQLQETIQRQQQQLQQQADQLKAQAELLQNLQQQVSALQTPAPTAQSGTVADTQAKPVVTSGNDKVKLAVSGQINRAVMIANDGAGSTLYHVDNTASNSRIRFVGSAKVNHDLTVGTRIEIAVSPDRSSEVSQKQKYLTDTYFDQRWVELSFDSKTFGKLSIGKGDTASNTTAEVDLSRTDVVQYSSIGDMGGGLLFRENTGARSFPTPNLKVSEAFKNLDGLSRQSRLRYDSPTLLGFRLAGSLVSGERSDLALLWSGQGYGFSGAGAFAASNPKTNDAGLMYDGSFSVLHNATGLNLTVSGGLQEYDLRTNATNLYAKAGWIANFTKLGYTAFGVDYARSENMAATGDRGYSVGGAVVQTFEGIATELYLQYRLFSLKRATGNPLADMNVGTFGARVKF